MFEKRFETENGYFYYIEKENRVTITTYHGNDVELELPAKIEDLPVRKIGKKAFMNARQLRRVVLPDSVKKLGEWAFAYCGMLEEIVLPKRKMSVGTGVFLGDSRLEKITLRLRKKDVERLDVGSSGENSESSEGKIELVELQQWAHSSEQYHEDMAVLLATVNTMDDAAYLFDFKEAGSEEWIQKWDARMLKILAEPDEKGYTQMILCGEEDINCNLENFVRDKRKKKVRYCFLRLLYSSGLADETKQILEAYLTSHVVGSPSMETWLVLKEEMGHKKEYYELYVELGCLDQENYDATLADLGDKQPEMKAYFIRWNDENKESGEDAFDMFSL